MAFSEKAFSKHLIRCERQCEFGEWDTVRMEYVRCSARHLEKSPKGWLYQLTIIEFLKATKTYGIAKKVTMMYCQNHAMEHARTLAEKK